MQIYKYMDIGTAKITREEMDGVRHFLVDELEPDEEFNVVVFQKMAKAALQDIYSRGKVPIVVGGTGFYIQALLYDIDFTDTKILVKRQQLLVRLSCYRKIRVAVTLEMNRLMNIEKSLVNWPMKKADCIFIRCLRK